MYVCEAETEIWLIRARDINFYDFFVIRPPLTNMDSAKNVEFGIFVLKCRSLGPFKR